MSTKEILQASREIHKQTLGPALVIVFFYKFLVGLSRSLLSMLSGAVSGESLSGVGEWLKELTATEEVDRGQVLAGLDQHIPKLLLAWAVSIALGWLVYSLFDALVKEGYFRWFSRNRELRVSEGFRPTPSRRLLFSFFKRENYAVTVKACFYKNLRLWLWAMPFYLLSLGVAYMNWRVVKQNLWLKHLLDSNPQEADIYYQTEWLDFGFWGFLLVTLFFLSIALYVSKRLSYSQADWFLADNPHLGGQRALELSEKLMQGKKKVRLLLAFAYLPWFLLPMALAMVPALMTLNAILLPLLYLFVDSRYHQAQAEFYANVRDEAVEKGLISMEELGYHRLPDSL
ncbi:MAG: DUF975 family protein [Eubacteriales bacterium]|nr:DUF975 family protein [Clostridiales bacterium]MDY5836444.1 DUF975 family protein [Eubacteriales bacterium]